MLSYATTTTLLRLTLYFSTPHPDLATPLPNLSTPHQLTSCNSVAGPGRNDEVCVDVQQADGEVQQLRHGGRQEPCR